VCGALSVVFTKVLGLSARLVERVPLPGWAKPTLGGVVVGLLGVLVTPRVLGSGYDTAEALVFNHPVETFLLVLIAAKLVATSVMLTSGGSGGVFAPSLMLGAVVGSAIGKISAHFVPVAPQGSYAVVGMAAFVAGATHAPVSMALMVFEMTRDYAIVLPLLIGTSVSSTLARRLYHESIDTILDAIK